MKKLLCFLFMCFLLHSWMVRPHVIYDHGILAKPGTNEYEKELMDRTQNAYLSEIVVELQDHLPLVQIEGLSKDLGVQMIADSEPSFEDQRLMIIRLDKQDPDRMEELLERLNTDQRVVIAEPNYVYSLPSPSILSPLAPSDVEGSPIDVKINEGEPNDPLFKYQWHMKMIHAPEVWAVTRGEGVVVAVIDTGVTHSGRVVEDLVGAEFVYPYNFINKSENANDDHCHGTHVAGTIAQVTNNGKGCVGVAPKAKIMPLKVLSKYGSGTVADIASAIIYAADKGANVINMSLGGPQRSAVMERAVDYAHSKGVIVVCAAGNSGPREGTVGYPAGYKNAVSVSAVDAEANLTWYSSWGDKVDISAPGGDTRVDKNGDGKPDGVLQNTIVPSDPSNMARYELFQGTSMASPHVAGVAALVYSKGVKNPDEVLKIMQTASQQKDNRKKYGAGIVDAAASVRLAIAWPWIHGFVLNQILGFYGAPHIPYPDFTDFFALAAEK